MLLGKVVVTGFSLLLVVGVVVGVIAAVNQSNGNKESIEKVSASMKAVSQFCSGTDFKDACINSLNSTNSTDPKELLKSVILAPQESIKKLFNLSDSLIVEANKSNDNTSKVALEECKELFDYAVDALQVTLSAVGDSELNSLNDRVNELSSWVSAVISFQTTCMENFKGENNTFKSSIQDGMVDSRELTSNALAVLSELSNILKSLGLQINAPSPTNNRRLLQVDNDGYPSWFSAADRRLLAKKGGHLKPNAVVAKDGSGQYKTIQAALDAYPKNLQGRYIIYIKAGVYDEYITVTKTQVNVFMYGDGNTKTIVTGSKSNTKGYNTWKTSSFSVVGTGFIAKNMGFANTAGPDGHQAVALRIQGDMAAVFNCRIDGYQDTLYTQAFRQFYRQCIISGTIDFIFGDGTAIIQSSTIIVRRPNDNQQNTITAQGKDLKREFSGLIIQNCTIVPDKALWYDRFKIKTYLGRPWRSEALTVFMESTFGDFIQPDGYMPWTGTNNMDTCKYYEYNNRGPGSMTDKRVKWPGVKVISKKEAEKYTVAVLLKGFDKYLKHSRVPFTSWLVY
ncbi:hypothetical protein ACOSQ3_000646 [Xanthoceras sorbifolium]